jgi:inorganic pyrophosphatase
MKMPGAFAENSNNINVIIETPKGNGVKYKFDQKTKLFKLNKILPEGLTFLFHFGFIPQTKGEDGDPLDVLVLLDELCYPGCHIECKAIGVIEAEQTKKKGIVRNDRIIATAVESSRYTKVNSISDLDDYLLDEVTNFFVNYNKMSGKVFKPLGKKNSKKAIKLIKKASINASN